MTAIILGAGASRGAAFVSGGERLCLPPLDNDFFDQLQRLSMTKHKDTVKKVIKDTVELFGNNFKLTMEDVFTFLEHSLAMLETVRNDRAFEQKKIRKKKEDFLAGLAAVMEEAFCDKSTPTKMLECNHHKGLVEKLNGTDSIISFNYDCLIDLTLREFGDGKWNAQYGYGLPNTGEWELIGADRWNPKKEAGKKNETIKLYKLHGSLNWYTEGKTTTLKQRPYTKQRGNLQFNIIPPEWNKNINETVYRKLWREASIEIYRNKEFLIVGYSFPETDLHTAALFRVSLKKGNVGKLIIINPNREARDRAISAFSRGLSEATQIIVFEDLEEYAKLQYPFLHD